MASPSEAFAAVYGAITRSKLGQQEIGLRDRELQLGEQMQPYRIRSVQATIDELIERTAGNKTERSRLEKLMEFEAAEEARREASYETFEKPLDELMGAFFKSAGGHPDMGSGATGVATAQALGSMLAPRGMDSAGTPAALIGLPEPGAVAGIEDMIAGIRRSNAYAGLRGTASRPAAPSFNPNEEIAQILSGSTDRAAAAAAPSRRTWDDMRAAWAGREAGRAPAVALIRDMLASPVVGGSKDLQREIQSLLGGRAATLGDIESLPLDDLLRLRDDISWRVKRQMGL